MQHHCDQHDTHPHSTIMNNYMNSHLNVCGTHYLMFPKDLM